MALIVQNTKKLIDPTNFKMKILVYAPAGTGKTYWMSGANQISGGLGVGACEAGDSKGLLTIAENGIDYVGLNSYTDFDAFCGGAVFKDKAVIGLDSISDMSKTFIKDYALSIPRTKGNSPKREKGIPELDDYGVMGELVRRLLRKLLSLPQHVIVLATEKYKEADPDTPGSEACFKPDLPGAMADGAPAMFDFVFRMKARAKLRDPKDPKSRYVERYFITEQSGITLAKCRSQIGSVSLLNTEEIIDVKTGQGTFPEVLSRIQHRYAALMEEQSHAGVSGL